MGPPSRSTGFNLPAMGDLRGVSGSFLNGPLARFAAGGCTFRGVSATTGSRGGVKPWEKVASACSCFIAPDGHRPLPDRGTCSRRARPRARAPGLRWAFDWSGLISVLSDRVWCMGSGCPELGTQGQWRLGRHPIRPVLKHGPRSLTSARVIGSGILKAQ